MSWMEFARVLSVTFLLSGLGGAILSDLMGRHDLGGGMVLVALLGWAMWMGTLVVRLGHRLWWCRRDDE